MVWVWFLVSGKRGGRRLRCKQVGGTNPAGHWRKTQGSHARIPGAYPCNRAYAVCKHAGGNRAPQGGNIDQVAESLIMEPAPHIRAPGRGYLGALAIALALTVFAGCERPRTIVEPAEPAARSAPALVNHDVLAAEHQVQAMSAQASGAFVGCADEFAEAAKAALKPSTIAANWYEASRCAARAGDFRTSTFYLNSAASNGFAELPKLMGEPLFRPLHSGSRWDLVVDLVAANERALPSKANAPDGEEPAVPVCEIIELLRERLQAPG